MSEVKIIKNPQNKKLGNINFLGEEQADKTRKFHSSFPMYKETPLTSLDALAEHLGIKKLYVKDESYRFGINSFKVLGGSYAMGRIIGQHMGVPEENVNFDYIKSPQVKENIADMTFISATDGNHGRGVAWTAHQLGCKCVIHMPKNTVNERLENIRKEGAYADITELSYDGAVSLSAKEAEENGYTLVQDTSWEGYEQIPTWIMQGYMTMMCETYSQLKAQNQMPTHVFIQAGVGSVAASVTGYFSNIYHENPPKIIVIESDKADCIYQTAKANDGKIHSVTDEIETIMAGLACGSPCGVAWDVLSDYTDYFVSCSDEVTENGMRTLAYPLGNDTKIVSGESGAVGVGLVTELMTDIKYRDLREKIGLNEDSVVICFSTEGATNLEGYKKIVGEKYEKYID